jgi:hypothetical protein
MARHPGAVMRKEPFKVIILQVWFAVAVESGVKSS